MTKINNNSMENNSSPLENKINAFKPISREPLAKNITLTKNQINSLIFYKRLIESKNDLEIKEWSKIPEKVLKHIIWYNYNVLAPNMTYCIDDRTTEQITKWVSIPWWTDWLLAAAYEYLTELWLSEEITPEDVYKSLLVTIWGLDNYYTHSDTHNINNKWWIWCWHCKVAFEKEWHVLNISKIYEDFMLSLRRINKAQDKLELLEWDHNPDWVLLIDNENSPDKLSIIQKWKNSQYFVYNRNAEKNILKRFLWELNKLEDINIELDEKKLDNIAFEAYLSTLKHLWWWELPHYTIVYRKELWKYRIKTIWNVNDFVQKYEKRKEEENY